MKTTQMLLLSAAAVLLTSCSGKLGALSADNFKVTPNPLETQAGEVSATINGMFPEKYMKKKAVVTVTPQLRFQTPQGLKSVNGEGATFQGEKVLGNDQTISYLVGGNYTMKTNFAYTPEMQQSDMYLIFDAKVGKKTVKVPEVKVATGIIATSELYKRTLTSANPALAEDAFQRISEQKQQANIKFLIGQAQLRKSELQNNSVQEFVRLINKIVADQEGMALDNIEVSAYASPDGGYALNEKLANKRQDVTNDYLKKEMKKAKMDAPVDTKYTAEDWEGFQALVSQSNLQDKEIILRVLSMYQDPEQREREIRNVAVVYKELADAVLPELRRARMVINYDVIGRSDEAIMQLVNGDVSKLSIEELIYAANTLSTSDAQKESILKKVVSLFPNDYRAYNNLGELAMRRGDTETAQSYLRQALGINANAAEPNVNLGMLAIQNGQFQDAEMFISKGVNANNFDEATGHLYVAQGRYPQAAAKFANSANNSAALANILSQDYADALKTLGNIKNPDAMTYYLRAILAARMEDKSEVKDNLAKAIALDASLAKRAANDAEFSDYNKE